MQKQHYYSVKMSINSVSVVKSEIEMSFTDATQMAVILNRLFNNQNILFTVYYLGTYEKE